MSLSIVHSRAQIGVDAPAVTVEVHLANGLPSLTMVGLPEAAVKESKDRVRSAIINSGLQFPPRRITLNLAPADLPKDGGRFDLAIALGILSASVQVPTLTLDDVECLGELALSGAVRAVRGVLPAALAARKAGRSLVVPRANAEEACLASGLKVIAVDHLLEAVAHFNGHTPIEPYVSNGLLYASKPYPDLNEVQGQLAAKRALLIAAAGAHNLLLLCDNAPKHSGSIVMKPKAYSYIRFSSPEQARGNSYKRQREAAERYCEENGLELASTNEYTFFDAGRSAFKGKHIDDSGELGRFLKYVEDGVIEPGSYLLVESLDRLSREKVRDALPRFLDLLARGIRVYTSADKRLYTKDFNEIDLILSIVSMSRAHEESSVKGMRVAKAWRNKQELARTAKKPLGAACPYWLQLVKDEYVPVKDRVDVIRRIFDMTIHGYGQAAISRRLNEDGVPVFGSTFETKPKPRNKSGAWGTSSVQKILNNRAVLGEYQPTYLQDGVRTNEGDAVEGFFPEVITPDVFLRAQAARTQRKTTQATKQSKNFNIWQGLAKCRLCGDAMHLINKGRPPKGYTYLQCYSAKKGKCRSGSIRIEQTEAVFKEILTKVDSMSLVQGRAAGILKGLQIAEGQLAAITDKLNKADEAHREYPSKRSGRLVQELELELEQLEKDRNELRQQITSSRVISRVDFFQKLDLVTYEGRAAANSLLKRLGIEVQFKRQNPGTFRCWALDKSNEDAAQENDQILFGILYENGALTVQALDNDVFIRQIEQGEITAEDVNRDYEGGIDSQWFGTVFGKKK